MEILDESTRTVDNSLVIKTHDGGGHRMLVRGDRLIADENDLQWAYAAKYAAAVHKVPTIQSVAIIGGGFCLTPRVMGPHHDYTIFELEPALRRFAPRGATFIEGDWRITFPPMAQEFDAVILDTGETLEASGIAGMVGPGCLVLSYETV